MIGEAIIWKHALKKLSLYKSIQRSSTERSSVLKSGETVHNYWKRHWGKEKGRIIFFFFPFSSSPIFQNFPSILSIKNHFQPTKWFSFSSTNRYIIARHHFLSFTPPRRVFTTSAPIFLSIETYITFSILIPDSVSDAKCVLSFNRPHPSSSPVLLPILSLSLCAFYTERALLEFTYPTIETNRVIYTFAAIWAHTAERRAEVEGEGACTTPLKIQTSDTSNK